MYYVRIIQREYFIVADRNLQAKGKVALHHAKKAR